MQKWLKLEEMIEFYGMSKDSLHQFAYHDREERKYTKKQGSRMYYNVEKLEAMREHRVKTWNEAHDLYYHMTGVLGLSDFGMGKDLVSKGYGTSETSWCVYFGHSMFSRIDEISIISVNHRITQLENFHEWATRKLNGEFDEPTMEHFDKVEDYFGYYEMMRIIDKEISRCKGKKCTIN